MIDDSDHVEAAGYDTCLGEVQPHQRAVIRGQIHTHYPHLGFAFQALKIGLQREFGAAQHDIVDLMIPQIT